MTESAVGQQIPVSTEHPVGRISTTILLAKDTRLKLRELKRELGFGSYNDLLTYVVLEVTRGAAIPPAQYSMVFEKTATRPVIMTGESGSGKTTAVKELLSHWSGSVFALDVSNEYEFKKLDLGSFYSLNWEKEKLHVRFIPHSNVEISKAEAANIFSHLNFIKNSGVLKNWVLVIEEAHRFSSDANLRALLIEARKFVRKFILVTTDWRVYEGIAKVFKPRPWELTVPLSQQALTA